MDTIRPSSDPLIIIRANRLLKYNDAAASLFGYEQKDEMLGLLPHELLAPGQLDGISAPQKLLYIWEQACEEGVYKDVVIGHKRNGENFVADLQIFSHTTEEGEMLYYTRWLERKADAQKPPILKGSYNAAYESDDVAGIINISRTGRIIYANREVYEWLQFCEEELIQKLSLQDILASVPVLKGNLADRQEMPKWVKKSLQDWAEKDGKVVFLNKGLEQQLAEVSCRLLPYQDKQDVYCQLIVRPVPDKVQGNNYIENTELELASLRQENKNLKRLQKVLKKSLDRLRVLAEYSPDVIMQFDRAHRHLFVNSQVEKQTSFKVEEYLGKTHIEMGFPPDFSKICEQALEKVFISGKSNRIELLLPNGIWVDWFLIPEFNSRGEVKTVITTARDITEQKKTQLKLRKSERRLNDAFEVTKLSSWEFDVRSGEFCLSDNFKKLIGDPSGNNRPLKALDYLKQYVVAEDIGKFRFVIDSGLKACNEDFQEVLDYRVRKQDGEIVHILASVRLELDEEGNVASFYGTNQDITQLRLTEQELEEYRTSLERLVETRTQELKKSEAKLSDALRLANLGGWEYDPVADCFVVSDEALEIVGTTPDIEGGNIISIKRSHDIIHPDDYEQYRQAVYAARETADEYYAAHTEFRIIRTDGDIRNIYLSIKANHSGPYTKYYGTLQDITDIRRTELEKNRLNAIVEATTDIVGIVRPEGGIIYLNQAGKDFFGVKSEEELQLKSFSDFQQRKSEQLPSSKDLTEADAKGTWSGQNYYLRFDGVEVPVSQVVISHKNAEGQVECYSTIIRDISQQKRIEQDLIFKNNELDTFVYRASHDLRGPIATLMGLYNLVHYEVQEEQALRLFKMYNSQVQRLNTITLTLIELTKIKESEFQPSLVDFQKLVGSVFGNMQNLVESKGMVFEQDIEVSEFVSDERLLNIILQNLVENSIKYKRQDAKSFVRVEIKQKEYNGRLQIKVSDNGIGIDSAIQGKIYNMFFRGNERSSGSGLGLYMLKNAVEKLGGRVTLYSVLYKGTTFKIELPCLSDHEKVSS